MSIIMLIDIKAFAITPSRLRDGIVDFAICTVGGQWAFTQAEKTALLDENSAATVIDITPTAFEIQVARSGIKFHNYSDFKDSVESKSYLDDKILDMKPSDAKREKTKIDALKVENNKR